MALPQLPQQLPSLSGKSLLGGIAALIVLATMSLFTVTKPRPRSGSSWVKLSRITTSRVCT